MQFGRKVAMESKLQVFISYSRDDLAFADQLCAGLKLTGFDTTVDRHSIAGGEEWQSRLGALIRDADTVLFLLSPSSARSDICAWEVEEAARCGKRIIPVACKPLDGATPPPRLSERNYIFFYPEEASPEGGFGTGLTSLVDALKTNLGWLREHTRLLQRASEWRASGLAGSRLLFGDSIAEAMSWLAERPSEAPEPTALHHEFIRASEEAQARRENTERQQLEKMTAALAERAKALAAKDAAQKREAEQARRVVRRTLVGLVVSAAFAAIAGAAGWNAHLRKLALEQQTVVLTTANQRLSAQIKLRIAPFGKFAYSISEHWYKLATTNASSIAFIEVKNEGNWQNAGSGFLISGKALHDQLSNETLLVTANHVVEKVDTVADLRVSFPAGGDIRKIGVKEVVWRSQSSYSENLRESGIDVVVMRLSEAPPRGTVSVQEIGRLELEQWGAVDLGSKLGVKESTLREPFPLIILGAAIDADNGTDEGRSDAFMLTMSLANALGRTWQTYKGKGVEKIVFTDSTTVGGSGSPVFDANNGHVVAIVQFGSSARPKAGLAYSGGIAMTAVKKEIAKTFDVPLEMGRWLLAEGRTDEAWVLFKSALATNRASTQDIVQAYIDVGASFRQRNKGDVAEICFMRAFELDPSAAERIAVARDPDAVARTQIENAVSALKSGKFDEARIYFDRARRVKGTESHQVLNQIAWHWMMHGKPEEGLPYIDDALALLVTTDTGTGAYLSLSIPGYDDTRGHILLGLNRLDEALRDFDRAIEGRVNYPGVFYGRGRAHELAGKKVVAIADYQRAIEAPGPDSDSEHFVKLAKERLQAFAANCQLSRGIGELGCGALKTGESATPMTGALP